VSQYQLANIAGGVIRGDEITLSTRGDASRVTNQESSILNTGFMTAARSLTLDTKELRNEKRSADIGEIHQAEEDGYFKLTGDTVQPGGFLSAAELQINADKVHSLSGEFQVLGESEADTQTRSNAFLTSLRQSLGENFTEASNQDHIASEWVQVSKPDPWVQVAILVAAVVVSIYTAGAASGLVASAMSAGTGTFFGAAGVVGTQVVAAGLGNVMLSAALTSTLTSAATQLMTTGSLDIGSALQSGLVSGLTAGITRGIGSEFGNETLAGGHVIEGAGGKLVVASQGVTSLSDKALGYGIRSVTTATVEQIVYANKAGSFATAAINSIAASASADAANWVGTNTDAHSIENIGGHALVGCAAALATGGDCGAGALGAAAAAALNPVVDQFLPVEQIDLRNATLAGITTAATGVAAIGLGLQVDTAVHAAQNETINNYLSQAQKLRFAKELSDADSFAQRVGIAAKYGLINTAQDAGFAAGFVGGVPGEVAIGVYDLLGVVSSPLQFAAAMKAFIESDRKLGLLKDGVVNDLRDRVDRYQATYESGGLDSVAAGFEAGRLFTLVATSLTGVVGAARGGITVASKITKLVRKAFGRDPSLADASKMLGKPVQPVEVGVGNGTVKLVVPDKIDLANMDGPMSFRGPDLGNISKSNPGTGALGEIIGKQVLKEVTDLDFRGIQNSSGHGVDLLAIDVENKAIIHVQVKTTEVQRLQGPGDMAADYKRWITEAARDGTIKGQPLDFNSVQLAKQVRALEAIDLYRVEHRVLDVAVPAKGKSGSTTMTLSPYPRPSQAVVPGRP
jgi:hypothetical protein